MSRGSWGKSGLLAVVFALLLVTTAPTALGATADLSSSLEVDSTQWEPPSQQELPAQQVPPAQQKPPSENNSSVAHQNPSEVSDDESLADVEVWLSREMSDRLSESADVSQADRERARELLGNDSEYAELAEQYAEVANRTGSGSAAENFATAGQLQRQFIADVEQYRRVHEAYQNARANDEGNRTLRLAHELERHAAGVNRTAARLNESYANISADEQDDLQNATRTIGEMRANVTQTQQTVRDQTLVRTELSVRATEPGGSFTDPVPLAGRLQTADGEPVADENVPLRVGNRTLNATTDEEGRFEVEYRPTHAPVGDRPREVAFRPGNESEYLWDSATAEFGVRQITPNVTISNRTETVRYNETLTVNGTVAAEGVGVPDVPVVVFADGLRVAQARTGADGSFGAAGRLPGNVSNGSQPVRVQVVPENATSGAFGPGELSPGNLGSGSASESDSGTELDSSAEPVRNLAIAPANGSAEITVESTPTSLSIADVQTFNETVLVAGRLTTEGGEPLANQTVELRIGDRSVGTATTNATGDYATTVGLPSRLVGGDSTIRVVAAYSPSGGNLAPATADRTAELGSTGAVISDQQLRFGAAGLLVVAALGAFVWRFRLSGGASVDRETDLGAGETGEQSGAQASEFTDVRGRSAEALFDSATTALNDGTFDAAAVAAYGAVRRRFEDGDGLGAGDDGLETGDNGLRTEDDGLGIGDGGLGTGDGESREGGDRLRTRGGGQRTPRTHWEFYVACRDGGVSDERLRRLERLTQTYERAAFADEPVSEDEAREAVADATALREALSPPSPDAETLDAGRSERERTGRGSGDPDGSPAA